MDRRAVQKWLMTQPQATTEVSVQLTTWGSGPRVVMVHGGSPGGGREAFAEQRPLAEFWELILPDRPGHGRTPQLGREDFERDARLLLPLLSEPAHLVGHSYGAMVALVMALHAPRAVHSLMLIEPPAYSVDIGNAIVDAMAHDNRQLIAHPPADSLALLRGFFALVGSDATLPDVPEDRLPARLRNAADMLRNMRSPHEADIPVAALRLAGYPFCVLTSGRTPGFEAIAEAFERKAGAKHVLVPGADHAVQDKGEIVNVVMDAFWRTG